MTTWDDVRTAYLGARAVTARAPEVLRVHPETRRDLIAEADSHLWQMGTPARVFGMQVEVDHRIPPGMIVVVPVRAAEAEPVSYVPAVTWNRCEQVSGSGYARHGDPVSPDAMRLDASCAEADAELAEWRALLDAAKGRRR